MSSLPGIIGLLIFTYARPHEFFKDLQEYNFLYVFLFASMIGILHDVSERRTKLIYPPATPIALGFGAWCIITLAIRKPDEVLHRATLVGVCTLLYLLLAQGVQRISSFYRVITVIFALGVFVAYVGANQGLSKFGCVIYDPKNKNSRMWPDGRECFMTEWDGAPHDGQLDCIATGQPGIAYDCEHTGLFGTTSCGGGRVRYLGVLLDPNELALATALTVPFGFAFYEIRRSTTRLAMLLGTLAIVTMEIVFTKSRGGQIALGAVLGSYFVKKYGIARGAIVGAVLAIPILVLGGRGGQAASDSTLERLNCAAAGIKMLLSYPFTGVGYLQFTEHHFLTAHSAYLLAVGELGLPGMWMFGIMVYLGIKIPWTVLQYKIPPIPETKENLRALEDARNIKALAMGLLAAMIGASVGIFFLSWTYHYVLWIHWGLCGAMWSSVRRTYPGYRYVFTWKEARNIFWGYVAFLVFWTGFIKYKGAWELDKYLGPGMV